MRHVAYCFGPVTAVRRDALEAIGGFGMLSFHLADDFMLGRMIAAAGYQARLARYAWCVLLHYLAQWRFGITTPASAWLLPLRECLCFAVWLASFRSSNVSWRQRDFVMASGGRLEPRAIEAAPASGGR